MRCFHEMFFAFSTDLPAFLENRVNIESLLLVYLICSCLYTCDQCIILALFSSLRYLCFCLNCFPAFKSIEGQQAGVQKLVYIIGNLLCLAMAIYKCQTMGLLPTHASDWLAFAQPQQVMGA